jgi:hypothetical protein
MGEFQMKTGIRLVAIGALTVVVSGIGMMSVASAQSCQDLWAERNGYYKDAGFCFKTSRAISYFGNGGCRYENEGSVPLSAAARARIGQIVAMERRQGCSG